jgi:hypothetical protein
LSPLQHKQDRRLVGVRLGAAIALGTDTRSSSAYAAHPPELRVVSDSEEIALGAALLEKFHADRGVVATPQSRRIEAYLQSVADSLGKHAKRKLPWHIHFDRRDIRTPSQWGWDEFGASYGDTLENLCDYDGAKLVVKAGYSPYGFKTLLQSFVALGNVHAKSPQKAIVDRIAHIEREIVMEHWEALTKTRPLRPPP